MSLAQQSDEEQDPYKVVVYEHDHGRREPNEKTGGTHEQHFTVVGHETTAGGFLKLYLADGEEFEEATFARESITSYRVESHSDE